MKHLIVVIAILLLASPALAAKRVKGYVRKGKYVAPHFKTKQNKTKIDNYSSKGNVSPFTGKKGTKDPLAPKKP